MNVSRYAVKNAKTGQMFAGFDGAGNVIWGDERTAQAMTQSDARLQAALFRAMAVSAQLKPVAL